MRSRVFTDSIRRHLIELADEQWKGGHWLPVVSMDLPSWQGGPKVFPVSGMLKAGTREEAEKVFETYAKKWKGRGASSDSLHLIRFEGPVTIPKGGWEGTLRDFLKKFKGKINSGVGSSLR
jgi:hypothetical protein